MSEVGSSGNTTDTTAMIMADLGGGADATPAAPPPAVGEPPTGQTPEAEVSAEVAAIPETDEPVLTEAEPAPVVEDDSQRPDMPGLSESRWTRVHSGYRWAQEVGKALGVVGEDGRVDVTLFPSVEEISGMRSAYSDRLAMEHDFSSGDPANASTFIQNWNAFSPAGMTTVAAKLPEFLAQANPAGYNAMAGPVIQRFIDYAYQAANGEQNADRKGYLQGVARAMEWWATGGYDNGTYRSDSFPQQAAPNAIEQRLAASEAELRRIRGEGADTQWNTFIGGVHSDIQNAVAAEVEKALAPIKPHYPNTLAYESVRSSFYERLKHALAADAVGKRQYDVAQERTRRTQNPADKTNLINLYTTQVKRAMQTLRGPFLAEAGKGIKAVSDNRHAQLQRGAAQTAPTSGGAPRQQSIAGPLAREKSETTAEYQARMIQRDLGLTG